MKISKELQDIRNALRPTTQRTAQKLMQEIEQQRQKAAERGDKEEAFYLAEQLKNIAESSIIADNIAIDNAVMSWNKRKAEQKAEADKAQKAIEPPSDPVARLNAARKLQARKDKSA
jgi:DNA-binding protein H-NS